MVYISGALLHHILWRMQRAGTPLEDHRGSRDTYNVAIQAAAEAKAHARMEYQMTMLMAGDAE